MGSGGGGPGVDRRRQARLEQQVRQAAETGRLVDLRARTPVLDEPARGATWGAARTVRAELLVELLTRSGDEPCRAVELRGARIAGPLDLGGATLTCPLLLQDCYLDEPVDLGEARALTIRLPGCQLRQGLTGVQLFTQGNLELNQGFTADGGVSLIGAHIGGMLDCDAGQFVNPGGFAIDAAVATVDMAMFLGEGFVARGQVRLLGAHIGGQLNCHEGCFANPGGTALDAEQLTVAQSMFCGTGFTAQGQVRLLGANIGGQLVCDGGRFLNPGGYALDGEQLTVAQSMFCRGEPGARFVARGEVRLLGANIGGQLNCDGGRFLNPNGHALHGEQLTVTQSMFCRNGFVARGAVNLLGADIGGQLDCEGGLLANRNGRALNGKGLTVAQGMFCRKEFVARGEINLLGANIGGELNCDDGRFSKPGGCALNMEGAKASALYLRPASSSSGDVSLANAQVGRLHDDPASWPATAKLQLRGFVYESLENGAVKDRVRGRRAWLRRAPGRFNPQPYEQLAAVYRRDGDEQAARRVAIAKQWRRREVLGPLGKAWNWLLYVLVGYGYRTWLAGLWLLGLLLAGTAVFASAHDHQQLTEAKGARELQHFNPLMYTLDVLLPIVDLGQQGGWVPHRGAAVWFWVLTLAGWVLTTAVVAGLTGVLKRD
jgi:hypothetical protein